MNNKFTVGDKVWATPLTKDCAATEDFYGVVDSKREFLGKHFYNVQDQNGRVFVMEEHELTFDTD